jgi:RimJ/RimL family protein N-acetyltransferase
MSEEAPAPYPSELARAIVLPDGAQLALRPIRADDEPRLVALYARLSRHTAYQRFFTVMKRLAPDWAHFLANVDYRRRLALVVEHGPTAELIAVARYESLDEPGTAEIAFVVQDGWQNRGLGTLLLGDLLAAAGTRGLDRFRAYVLSENRRMLDLLHRFTDVLERKTESGVTSLLCARRASSPRRVTDRRP